MALLDNMRAARGGATPPGASPPAAPAVSDTLGSRLWSWVFVSPGFIISTFLHGVVNHFVAMGDPTGERQLRIARRWARSLLWIAGVKVETEGLESMRQGVSYIMVSNHLSYIDTPVILTHVP